MIAVTNQSVPQMKPHEKNVNQTSHRALRDPRIR